MSIYWTYKNPSRSFIPKVRKRVSEKTLEIALNVWQGAVNNTPVASGELRASWDLSRKSPSYKVVGRRDSSPGRSGAPLPPPIAPTFKASALRQDNYYITNGKIYARYVEYGSPTSPPHLMLTRSIRSAMR